MSRAVRRLQFVGLGLLLLSAFWPAYHFRAYPVPGPLPTHAEAAPVGFYVAGTQQVPARVVGSALLATIRGPDRVLPLWESRPWYPYLLVPIWIAALALAARWPQGADHPGRRGLGAALVGLSLGLAVFEGFYLVADYASFLPGWLGVLEGLGAWLIVVALLFYRRRADRAVGALEAAVAAQALLAFVHLLTLPSTMARPWVGLYELDAVAHSIWLNFPLAFWVGVVGLLFVSLPVYLRRTPA